MDMVGLFCLLQGAVFAIIQLLVLSTFCLQYADIFLHAALVRQILLTSELPMAGLNMTMPDCKCGLPFWLSFALLDFPWFFDRKHPRPGLPTLSLRWPGGQR